MNERDSRLLPRLIASLDTLDNEAEIVGAVRQIRRVAGADFFRNLVPDVIPIVTDDVSLDHPDREIAMRLRGLGLILRLATHPHPDVSAALYRTREAMIAGTHVSRSDLLITVACLRDMIQRESERRANVPRTILTGFSMNAELRESMDVLFGRMRGG
jgi:hypothetical protein